MIIKHRSKLILLSFQLIFLSLASTSLARAQTTPTPLEKLRQITDVYGLIQSEYVGPIDDTKLFNGCIAGMSKNLDTQSEFLDNDTLNDMRGNPSKDEGNVGLMLSRKMGLPYISGIIEGGPAYRADMKVKDYIVAVDGESTEELSLRDVLKKMTGKVGAQITISTRHSGEIEERKYSLIREQVATPEVKAKLLVPNVAYIALNLLHGETPKAIRTAFRTLATQNGGTLQGLILDLRNSPGGTLPAAGETAAMFLPEHTLIFTSEGKVPGSNLSVFADPNYFRQFHSQFVDTWPEEMKTIALVVIVDGATAAGSEIITAAMQDHRRAVIVGSKTFGRGSVQTIHLIGTDGGIKLTSAYYKTPNGHTIQNVGITPDVPLIENRDQANGDPWINSALDILKERSKS